MKKLKRILKKKFRGFDPTEMPLDASSELNTKLLDTHLPTQLDSRIGQFEQTVVMEDMPKTVQEDWGTQRAAPPKPLSRDKEMKSMSPPRLAERLRRASSQSTPKPARGPRDWHVVFVKARSLALWMGTGTFIGWALGGDGYYGIAVFGTAAFVVWSVID